MSKRKVATFDTCSVATQKYIKGRNYMINMVKKEMSEFKFKDYEGDYKEYLKELRQYQYKIDGYKEDIKTALLLDGDNEIPIGSLY